MNGQRLPTGERQGAARPGTGDARTSRQDAPRSGSNGAPLGAGGIPWIPNTPSGAVVAPLGGGRSGRSLYSLRTGRLAGLPPAPAGEYDTYRYMNTESTVAMSRAVVFGPIIAAPWSVEKKSEDVPDEWVDLVKEVFLPLENTYKVSTLRALDFGNRSYEQLYDVLTLPGSGKAYIGVRKFKPLAADITEVLVEDGSGEYAGLRNTGVDLTPEETLHVVNDAENDDPYGRSRHENIREFAWWPKLCQLDALGKLNRKNSNIIPIVEGPLSETETDPKTGEEIDGVDAAQIIIDAIAYGDGVAVERLMHEVDEIEKTGEPVARWKITPYDTGNAASAYAGSDAALRYFDAQISRGWLRPERASQEGQFGTKAEAGVHTDVGLAEGELIHKHLILTPLNWHSVDRILAWNFGEEARGQVYLTSAPLTDERKQIAQWFLGLLLANPAFLDLILTRINLDALAEQLDIPTTAGLNISNRDELIPVADPNAPPDNGPGANDPAAAAQRLARAGFRLKGLRRHGRYTPKARRGGKAGNRPGSFLSWR